MAFVERFKQEPMYGMSTKKGAVVERWPIEEVECISVLTEQEKLLVRLQLCFKVFVLP